MFEFFWRVIAPIILAVPTIGVARALGSDWTWYAIFGVASIAWLIVVNVPSAIDEIGDIF